jgi:alpha-D-xyloside xylohydrolase
VPWSGNIDTPQYRELYIRWLQWSTFLPFMRNHGSRTCNFQNAYTCNNEPWTYGDENTPIIASYINLRYQLHDYLQVIFEQFHKTGRMIMRPLYMDFSISDPTINKRSAVNDNVTTQQYMFGPRLLVTPVTLPNATEWDVYLPQPAGSSSGNGTKPWTYWWTNQTYAGGQTVKVPTPVKHIPVFYLGSREDILSGHVF